MDLREIKNNKSGEEPIGFMCYETVGITCCNPNIFMPKWRRMLTMRYWRMRKFTWQMRLRELWFKIKSKKMHTEMIWPKVGMASLVEIMAKDFPLRFGNYFDFTNGYKCLNMWAENLEEWAKNNKGMIEVTVFNGRFAIVTDKRITGDWLTNDNYGLVQYGLDKATEREILKAFPCFKKELKANSGVVYFTTEPEYIGKIGE